MFRLGISWGCRSNQITSFTSRLQAGADRTGRVMRVKPGLEAQIEISVHEEGLALLDRSGRGTTGTENCPAIQRYRGSWAEQSVVARLATKRTKKATRITTTPPTVMRSQRSEFSGASNSGFRVITFVLTSSFTGPKGVCSDQHHRHVLCRSRGPTQTKILLISI